MTRLAPPLLLAAIERHDIEAAQLILEHEPDMDFYVEGSSVLHEVVRNHLFELIPYMVSRGAPISWRDYTGHTPLHVAALKGLPDTIKACLENGAQVDEEVRSTSDMGPTGITALHLACGNNRADNALALLNNGADPRKADLDDWQPIHRAAQAGSMPIISLLVGRGADIRSKALIDGSEYDVLGVAAYHGKIKAVKALYDMGAPLTSKARIDNPHPEVFEFLMQRGASFDFRVPHDHPSRELAENYATALETLMKKRTPFVDSALVLFAKSFSAENFKEPRELHLGVTVKLNAEGVLKLCALAGIFPISEITPGTRAVGVAAELAIELERMKQLVQTRIKPRAAAAGAGAAGGAGAGIGALVAAAPAARTGGGGGGESEEEVDAGSSLLGGRKYPKAKEAKPGTTVAASDDGAGVGYIPLSGGDDERGGGR